MIIYSLNLSEVLLVLGGLLGAVYLTAVISPGRGRSWVRQFPRHRIAGIVLTAVDLVWAAYLLYHARVELIVRFRMALFILAPLGFFLIITHMEELLASRALGGFLMLIPAPVLHAARMSHSDWWYVPSVLAYVLAVLGIIFFLSPYRFRTMAAYWVESDQRCRTGGLLGVAVGALLVWAGIAVY